ncbi:MAG: hypothetical protein K6G40_07235 [Eubacterium sp.]|nr:hypothetical protein [Eubacterium sp.]
MLISKIVEAPTPWHVDKTYHLYDLIIKDGAKLIPPEGKFLTLTVNGVGCDIKPGVYRGDVVVSVTTPYHIGPHGLMVINQIENDLKQAAVISNNKVVEEQCVPAILQDAVLGEKETDGLYLASSEEDFNGIVFDGDTKYILKNSRFDMEGNGHNDWLGLGAAITAIDNVDLTVENSQFNFSGVTRCLLQVAGRSTVTLKDCSLINIGPDGEDWVGSFSWAVGFKGYNRVAQLCDSAKVLYDHCDIRGNGWGLLSIDGSDDPVDMYVKDSTLTLTGARSHGYGAFCIGDNHITYDHSKVDVFGYPILLMGMEGKGVFDVKNGCEITGRRFGAFIIDDDNSHLNISDSKFKTGKSSICIKGSSTVINVKNTEFVAGNGTVLQLMDCDEAGMNVENFKIPVKVKDEKDENRNLSTVSESEDVTLNLTDCNITGNFYNSTTNIRAYSWGTVGGMGKLHDIVIGEMPMPDPEKPLPKGTEERHNGDDLKGAKNLGINLSNTSIEGIISAASQKYRDGLTLITCENRDELSNITQESALPVNNGVVVTIDSASKWIVTDTCYITALTIANGGMIEAAKGKELSIKIDGTETTITSGTYTGTIELSVH